MLTVQERFGVRLATLSRQAGRYGLALGLCLIPAGSWARLNISGVERDGRALSVRSEPGGPLNTLRISSAARSVRIHFLDTAVDSSSNARLRYRLEGVDGAWRDLKPPMAMKLEVRFSDANSRNVGVTSFELNGETAGWRGAVETSDYVTRRTDVQIVAPPRSTKARVALTSNGQNEGVGVIAVDAVRLRVEPAQEGQTQTYDLNVTPGTDLDQPLGSPFLWVREGTRSEMAQVLTRLTPSPHPVLALIDDDPACFAAWALYNIRLISVEPGDRLSLEWQMAHSIGSGGRGTAEYTQLKPGRYVFRLATAKANGELAGEELALPLLIYTPLYGRVDFWLLLGLLVFASTAWASWALLRLRLRQTLAFQHERLRIASDLHDNLGAGLSEIAMQSDWIYNDLSLTPTADTQRRAACIRQSATELARCVDEIVWAMNPNNDNVANFINYLLQNASQFLDAANLRARFDVPPDLPEKELAGKVRHALFLAVREALNNVAKHARADLVRLDIRIEGNELRIAVEDNGCGFESAQASESEGTREGLEGMRRRMGEVGGDFRLTSQPGRGTRVELSVTLPV